MIAEKGLVFFLNSQLHKLNTNESFKQNPQNPSASVSSHPIMFSVSGIGSRRGRNSMCCPAPGLTRQTLQTGVSGSGGPVCCVTVASVPDGSCVTRTPADTCQNAAASAGVG